ncbi:hypothetical protein [Kitasatospora sp. NPDC050463]
MRSSGAETVRLTLGGQELAPGALLDATGLALGSHTLRAGSGTEAATGA